MTRENKSIHESGLGHLCKAPLNDRIHISEPAPGIELMRAWFAGEAYSKHRHDTYAIGLTDSGVQSFNYRGSLESSLPGSVMVLHPDESHTGQAGSDDGFGYRMLYVDPAIIADAVQEIAGHRGSLPFVHQAVSANKQLAQAIQLASEQEISATESLAKDEIFECLAKGLIAGDRNHTRFDKHFTIDFPAVDKARDFLNTELTRAVHSAELVAITGLSRYDLARQFRKTFGTSPYRYSLNRRLNLARFLLLNKNKSISYVALETGFGDQAHFNRQFKAAYGISPGRYQKITQLKQRIAK